MRSNDGAVDSQGRFWVETFVDPTVFELTNESVVFASTMMDLYTLCTRR
jgi:sugar lactone lactonase YvrE